MIEMPWTKQTVPHAVIEITQRCNLACRACYREKRDITKTVEDVLRDVETIERYQRVQTISLAGGEPTLHPELIEIVRRVKARGHRTAVVTNGLLLTDALLAELAAANLDIVMIHVDEGQTRPDLKCPADIDEVTRLRETLAARVARHGIQVGLCTTLYEDSLAHLPALVGCFLRHAHINYLFATHAVRIPTLVAHTGDCGFQDAPTLNSMVMRLLRKEYGWEPFAYVAPIVAGGKDDEKPCVSYCVPVLHGPKTECFIMKSGPADLAMIRLVKRLCGRFLYYCRPQTSAAVLQVLVNGLGGFRPRQTLAFLLKAARPGYRLRVKRLVFENAPVITAQGRINCCDACPNATVRDGRVMPVCLADHAQELAL